MSDALARWQRLPRFSDQQAAQHVGLELREYCRQRATRPSRQTALLAVLVSLYRPDLTKIHQALADLARPASPPIDETGPDARVLLELANP
jgi:hypothetical protein